MKQLTLLFVTLLTTTAMFAQNNITGRLADDSGQPIAFANVVLKTVTTDSLIRGTTTGEDGSFSIDCGDGTYNLVAPRMWDTKGSASAARRATSVR